MLNLCDFRSLEIKVNILFLLISKKIYTQQQKIYSSVFCSFSSILCLYKWINLKISDYDYYIAIFVVVGSSSSSLLLLLYLFLSNNHNNNKRMLIVMIHDNADVDEEDFDGNNGDEYLFLQS